MKLKVLLVGSIVVLTVFLIYLTTIDKKIYFLALGDSLANGMTSYGQTDDSYNDYVKIYLENKNLLERYVDGFIANDYRTTDLIKDIEENKKIIYNNKEQTIKNALIKADIVTLSIGSNDLLYKLSINDLSSNEMYNYIDQIIDDMEDLFELLREYCKEDIIVLGLYKSIAFSKNEEIKKYYQYMNDNLILLADNYKIKFLKLDQIIENNNEYMTDSKKIFLSRNGYEQISNEIIKIIENNIIK